MLWLRLKMQAYKVLGHIDILGDPLSLGKSISSGVIGFVTKVWPTWPPTFPLTSPFVPEMFLSVPAITSIEDDCRL